MKTGRKVRVLGLAILVAGALSFDEASTEADAAIAALTVPIIRPVDHIRSLAFGSGERIQFRFGWNDIPAAEMTMQVSREQHDGRWVYRYRGHAKTLPYIQWIYPLVDQVEALLDEASLQTMTYALLQDEKGVITSTSVTRNGAHIDGRRRDGKKKEYAIQVTHDGHYDPVSIAYLARSINLEVGKEYTYRVFDGRYDYLLTLAVEKRENIRVKAGVFPSLRIRPSVVNLSKPDGPRRIKRAHIWVSDDANRVPLRLESEVAFGKVYGELTHYSRGAPGLLVSAVP